MKASGQLLTVNTAETLSKIESKYGTVAAYRRECHPDLDYLPLRRAVLGKNTEGEIMQAHLSILNADGLLVQKELPGE